MANGNNTTKARPSVARKRAREARTGPQLAACAVLCLILAAFIAAFGCSTWAFADDGPVVHVSYQWFSEETGMVEDYETFDVSAGVSDGRLVAVVMPEGYALDGDCTWRVMKNFAGGLPAGEEDISSEAGYDDLAGVLSLPETRAGEDITIVFCMPWNHESHADHGHFRTSATRAVISGFAKRLNAAGGGMLKASGSAPTVGKTYALSISSGETGRWSSPVIYAADSDNAGAGGVFGYPEFEGRYKFYVAFERGNCELFELADAVPGRQGVGGTIYGSTGTPYNTDWAADYACC